MQLLYHSTIINFLDDARVSCLYLLLAIIWLRKFLVIYFVRYVTVKYHAGVSWTVNGPCSDTLVSCWLSAFLVFLFVSPRSQPCKPLHSADDFGFREVLKVTSRSSLTIRLPNFLTLNETVEILRLYHDLVGISS